MANMNVKVRLDKIEEEMKAITKHVEFHSGINPKDAKQILLSPEGISSAADRLGHIASVALT